MRALRPGQPRSEGLEQAQELSAPAGRDSSATGTVGCMKHGRLGSSHLSPGQRVSRHACRVPLWGFRTPWFSREEAGPKEHGLRFYKEFGVLGSWNKEQRAVAVRETLS